MSALGKLVVSLSLDYAAYTQGLDKASQESLKFAQNAQRNFDQALNSAKEFLTDTAKDVAGAVVAFAGFDSVISRTQAAIDSLNSLDDAAQKTGSSVEDLSRIQKTAKNFGDDFATIEQSITRLAKGLASIDDEGSQVLRALDAINVSARNADGQLRTSAQVYIDIAKSLQQYEDSANKTALVNTLFGKSGAELLPMLNNLADGVDDVTAASAASAAQAAQFNDQVAKSKAMVNGLFGSLAVELLPTLNNIASAMLSGAQSTNQFSVAGQVAVPVLKGMAIAGFTVIDTFKGIGREIGARVAQLTALAQMDFKGAGFIGDELAKDNAQARAEYDKFVDAVLNGDKALAQAADSGGMKKTLDFTLSMPAAAEKATQSTSTQISESERFIQSLTREVEQLGKTSAETKRLEAAKLGVLDAAAPLIEQIERETSAYKDAEAAANLYKDQLAKAVQITESVMTADERYTQTQAELNQLVDAGMISQGTYNSALQKAEEQFLQTGTVGKQAFDEMSQFAIQAQRNLQNALGDALFDGINGKFDDMVKGFKDAILRMITEAMAADILGALFNKRTGNLAGLAGAFGFGGPAMAGTGSGSSGIGMMDMASLGSNIMSLGMPALETGFGATTAAGSLISSVGSFFGSGSTAAFGAGLSGDLVAGVAAGVEAGLSGSAAASFASMGESAAAGIATLGAGLVGGFGGTMIAGDKELLGLSGSTTSAIGAGLGALVAGPLGALLGGLFGGGLNALFGRGPLKQKETNLIGDISAEGFSGITSTKFKAQGGAFRSDKIDRVMTDTDSGELLNQYKDLVEGGISSTLEPFADQASVYAVQLGQMLDESIGNIARSASSMADTLGIGTDALDNFSMSVNIASESGQALTDEQIAQVITDAGDAMARTLIPSIDTLRKSGESAYQALQRVSTEFSVLTGLGAALGNSLADTKAFLQNVSFEDRSAFVQNAGGADALAIKTQFFSDNFLSESERLKPNIEQLELEMSKLGLSADISRRQFRDLVQSFGQVGGISEEMMQGLLNVAPLFDKVKDGLAALYPEMQATADAAYDLASAESLLADKRSALIDAYHSEKSALESVASRFKDLASTLRDASDSLLLGSLSPLTPQQRLDEARNQFNQDRLAANAGDEAALQHLPESANAFLEASQVYNASSAAYLSDFNFVQQVLESAAVTADAQASTAELQLTELEKSVSKLVDIDNGVVSLAKAMEAYTQAVLQGFGNLAISDQAIRDYVSTHTTQESVDAMIKNGVSASQVAGALGVDQSVVNQAVGGRSVSDQQIRDFVSANSNDLMAIYNAARANGISSERLSEATGISLNDINQFVKDNNLDSFAVGTDLVPRDGLAMLHKGEAVTPSSTVTDIKSIKRRLDEQRINPVIYAPAPDIIRHAGTTTPHQAKNETASSLVEEVKALRQELAELRKEQNKQTNSLINVAIESQKMNADMIIKSKQESDKSAAWREKAKAGLR